MKINPHTNGVFYAHITTTAGPRRISLRTRNEREAHARAKEAKLAELEAAAQANALTAETVGRIVTGSRVTGLDVLAMWRDWATMAGLAPNSIHRYDLYARVFLRESGFETRAIGGVSEKHVDAFINPRDEVIVVSTRRNRLAAVSSLFEYAHAKGLTVGNPAALVRVRLSGLSFAQKERKKRVPFTEAEMALLRTVEAPFFSTVVLLGEHFGLRLSDVALLERACIAKPGVIVVWCDKRDRRLELSLPEHVRQHLDALESSHPSLFFPREAALAADPKRRSQLSMEFGRRLRRLGITDKSAHCLRHTFASKRAALGDTIDEIRGKLGHVAAATTLGYIHAA